MMKRLQLLPVILLTVTALAGCGKPKSANQPASTPAPFPGSAPRSGSGPVSSTIPPAPTVITPDQPVVATPNDPMSNASVVDINKDSPLRAVYFAYDSDALDDAARSTMTANADVLKKYTTWVVTIEGHCDERGTAEYNLALGDRRAEAVKNYMVSLGVAADRLKTVSYGSEFPFTPGHDEKSWAQNRRAHFMLTAKQ
jgi:peptidoglycan-associated lipoprotein